MPYSKIKSHAVKHKLSRKKVAELSPKDYNHVRHGHYPDFIHVDPSSHNSSMVHPLSHRLEKWILLVLLALAMAAFLGFKLLENSDMSFTVTDGTPQTHASNSLPSEAEFKESFKENRNEARAILEKQSRKTHKIMSATKAGAQKKPKRLVAKKGYPKKNGKYARKGHKKSVANR